MNPHAETLQRDGTKVKKSKKNTWEQRSNEGIKGRSGMRKKTGERAGRGGFLRKAKTQGGGRVTQKKNRKKIIKTRQKNSRRVWWLNSVWEKE